MLGVVLASTGQVNEAITCLQEAIRLVPEWQSPKDILNKVLTNLKKGDYTAPANVP